MENRVKYLDLHYRNLDKFFTETYKWSLLEQCETVKEIKKQILIDIKDEREYMKNYK